MGKIYCEECGAKNEYEINKPNFCSNCGFNFKTKSKSNKINKASQEEDEYKEDKNSDFSNASFVPKLSKLDYEVDLSSENNFFENKRKPLKSKRSGRQRKSKL